MTIRRKRTKKTSLQETTDSYWATPVIEDVAALAAGRHGDPFAFLGRHRDATGEIFRCFIPRAKAAWMEDESRAMVRFPDSDLFEYRGDFTEIPARPRLLWETDYGQRKSLHDPYCFAPALHRDAMQSWQDGKNFRAQELLGAYCREVEGIEGTLFAVWAPAAQRVSVVGDFNDWDGRCHPMRLHRQFGIWEIFIPGLTSGPYKYEIRNAGTGEVFLKSDPFARQTEQRPANASLIPTPARHRWQDAHWPRQRLQVNSLESPISVYEAHLGSWQRQPDGSFLSYRELAEKLCAHVLSLGFTHVELLPMKEHPLDESWGYQSTGYFAPTSRHGSPDDFRAFVDHFHQHGIGVILDWVPAHFPRDAHAMARFDGDVLFEYPDPRKAEQRDWGTLMFNYERNEVRSFLISSALYWLMEFHLDGLRVDAVASMLYLNFSREAEQWTPNRYGGHQNLEAIDFLQQLNSAVRNEAPSCLMVAEESSDWHGVTHPVESGGLGFHLKWNMGWMHDTLNYMSKDPIHRKHHQDWLTFGPVYAFNEHFILPLSHDEVVHLKKSLFGRMPGDDWQRFANLRLLYSYQWCYPGKQLLFMGGEFAQPGEWDAGSSLPWSRADEPLPQGVMKLLTRLNQLQSIHPALSRYDCNARGFEWLDGEDSQHSVLCFLRHADEESLVVVFNFTPEPRLEYRIPVHRPGRYRQIFNSDDSEYGGTGDYPADGLESEQVWHRGRPDSLRLNLPPLAALVLKQV